MRVRESAETPVSVSRMMALVLDLAMECVHSLEDSARAIEACENGNFDATGVARSKGEKHDR